AVGGRCDDLRSAYQARLRQQIDANQRRAKKRRNTRKRLAWREIVEIIKRDRSDLVRINRREISDTHQTAAPWNQPTRPASHSSVTLLPIAIPDGSPAPMADHPDHVKAV